MPVLVKVGILGLQSDSRKLCSSGHARKVRQRPDDSVGLPICKSLWVHELPQAFPAKLESAASFLGKRRELPAKHPKSWKASDTLPEMLESEN
jgi:hypothetical protein